MADSSVKDLEEFEYQLQAQQQSKPDEGASGTQTYTDPKDGTVYEWDNERRGWFPKVISLVFYFIFFNFRYRILF